MPLIITLSVGAVTCPLATAENPSCSNYWINPKTDQTECFHTTGSSLEPYSASDVVQPAQKAVSLPQTALNQQILAYAQTRLGQQVGDGECATLANEALKAAKAKTIEQLGPTGDNADYVWGTLLTTLGLANRSVAGIIPGDIIQFRNVSTYRKVTHPDGSWQTWTDSYPHHTAIVARVVSGQIELLQQNVGNNPQTKKTVQQGFLDLADLQSGTMWVYRPTR